MTDGRPQRPSQSPEGKAEASERRRCGQSHIEAWAPPTTQHGASWRSRL